MAAARGADEEEDGGLGQGFFPLSVSACAGCLRTRAGWHKLVFVGPTCLGPKLEYFFISPRESSICAICTIVLEKINSTMHSISQYMQQYLRFRAVLFLQRHYENDAEEPYYFVGKWSSDKDDATTRALDRMSRSGRRRGSSTHPPLFSTPRRSRTCRPDDVRPE